MRKVKKSICTPKNVKAEISESVWQNYNGELSFMMNLGIIEIG